MKLTAFNGWMLGKIAKYLVHNENCILEKHYGTNNSTKAVIMDTFGNRYEITVKALNQPGVENELFNKNDFVVFPTTQHNSKYE